MPESPATADICDEHEAVVGTCATQFRRFGGRPRFSGRIETVRCLEDNVLVRRTLSQPGDGRVLVVDGGGSLRVALMGDDMARLAATSGWAGVVVHGAVRDVGELGAIDLGLVALGANPRRSSKTGEGDVGRPVEFGGVVFTPGDLVYVDADGIAVVPAQHA
jgi:regulator of ribonuclease activity A